MITRIFSFFILLGVLYVGVVFFVPEYADTYGNKDINAIIRDIKNWADTFSKSQDPYLK